MGYGDGSIGMPCGRRRHEEEHDVNMRRGVYDMKDGGEGVGSAIRSWWQRGNCQWGVAMKKNGRHGVANGT